MKNSRQYVSRFTAYVSRFTQHDLAMVMLAMFMLRLLSVIALRVGGYVAETGPDSAYHFELGRLAASGAYPFVNYWVEYPPFFPWLSVLAYKLATLMPSWIDQRFWFNLALHSLIIPFDLANVALIYQLAKRVNGEALAIKSAWLYAVLFVPLFVVLGWFESIALCFLLLALWAILPNRPILAGIAIGLGILVKPYVALVGAVALLIYLRKNRRALWQLAKLMLAGVVTVLAGLLPFLIAAPQMVLAHLDTLLTLPGWSSPYALIDGVIKHVDPKVADRFDVALAASPLVPSRIPWGIVTFAFGVIYLVLLWRAMKRFKSASAQEDAQRERSSGPHRHRLGRAHLHLLSALVERLQPAMDAVPHCVSVHPAAQLPECGPDCLNGSVVYHRVAHHIHPAQRRCVLSHSARHRTHGLYRRVGLILWSVGFHRC